MSDDKKRPGQDENQEHVEHDNVIRFPVERVKSKRKLKKLAGKVGNNKKATLFLSLLSVLVMSAYLLQNIQGQADRNIASSDARDMAKEKELANSLSQPDVRNPASFGRKPASDEEFRRVFRNYLISNDERTGGLKEAVLEEGRSPVMVKHLYMDYEDDLAVFLRTYLDYIFPGADDVEVVAEVEPIMTAHHYRIMKDGKAVAKLRIVLQQSNDEYGPIHSIKVQAL